MLGHADHTGAGGGSPRQGRNLRHRRENAQGGSADVALERAVRPLDERAKTILDLAVSLRDAEPSAITQSPRPRW